MAIPAEDAIGFPSKIYEFHENDRVQDLAPNSNGLIVERGSFWTAHHLHIFPCALD